MPPTFIKAKITGEYSSKTKILKFREFDIVYTKSTYNETDFCFVNFESKINDFEKAKTFKGSFTGKYVDGKSCIDGELILVETKKLEKFKKKVEKIKKKQKIEPIDTLKLNPIVSGKNLNVVVNSNTLILSIYDSGKIDNDKINLFIDGKLMLENFSIKKEKHTVPLAIKKKKLDIKVVAINEGSSPPNTVKIEIKSLTDYIITKTALKTNETATLTLIKQ